MPNDCTQQVAIFAKAVEDMPQEVPNKNLWQGLVLVLTTMCMSLDSSLTILRGARNGDGLIARTRRVVDRLSRLGKLLQDASNEGSEEVLFDKSLRYIADKVLPPLIVAGILAALAWIAAVNADLHVVQIAQQATPAAQCIGVTPVIVP